MLRRDLLSFGMLLTLVASSNAENAETLWGFIGRYRPGVTKDTHPHLAKLVEYAIHYFHDFVLPAKHYREPSAAERAALIDLRDALSQLPRRPCTKRRSASARRRATAGRASHWRRTG